MLSKLVMSSLTDHIICFNTLGSGCGILLGGWRVILTNFQLQSLHFILTFFIPFYIFRFSIITFWSYFLPPLSFCLLDLQTPCCLCVYPSWLCSSHCPSASIMTMITNLIQWWGHHRPTAIKSAIAHSISPAPCIVTAASSNLFP